MADTLHSVQAELKRIERYKYLNEAYENGRLHLVLPNDEHVEWITNEFPKLVITVTDFVPGSLAYLYVEQELVTVPDLRNESEREADEQADATRPPLDPID